MRLADNWLRCKTNSYPIALLLLMSLSVGIGDSTGLRKTKMVFHRICEALVSSASTDITQVMTKHGKALKKQDKCVVSYLSGRIGSSSRFNIPWIPWQSSAGISVALREKIGKLNLRLTDY